MAVAARGGDQLYAVSAVLSVLVIAQQCNCAPGIGPTAAYPSTGAGRLSDCGIGTYPIFASFVIYPLI